MKVLKLPTHREVIKKLLMAEDAGGLQGVDLDKLPDDLIEMGSYNLVVAYLNKNPNHPAIERRGHETGNVVPVVFGR